MKSINVMEKLRQIDIKKTAIKAAIVAVIGLLTQVLASYVLTLVLDTFFPQTALEYSQRVSSFVSITPYKLLRVCVIFPIAEEVVFRLFLLGTLRKVMPFIFANIIQAALFGIYHGNVVQGVYAFILGLFIGYLYYICSGTFYTIVFHMFINLSGMYIEKFSEPLTTMFAKTTAALLCAAVISLLVYLIIRINGKITKI